MKIFDVIIIGGGPAGSAAALQLLAQGNSVALIEKRLFPREQIGESLSPGISNIFNYLQADELLACAEYLRNVPTGIIWENKTGSVRSDEHPGGIIVNRAQLDKDLVQLARSRGLTLFQPALITSTQRNKDLWVVNLRCQDSMQRIMAKFMLDARGRTGSRVAERLLTAPPTIAISGYLSGSMQLPAMHIEATNNGWIWASPVTDRRSRVIAFAEPAAIKNKTLQNALREVLSESRLFKNAPISNIQGCLVLNYAHSSPWEDHYLRIGETAFALDPLTSCGVEKAMRFSLQAATVVNTVVKTNETALAKDFFEKQIIESVANHAEWTRVYYQLAWPSTENPFWKKRAQSYFEPCHTIQTAFSEKLEKAFFTSREKSALALASRQSKSYSLSDLWHDPVTLSAELSFSSVSCIEGDRVVAKTAIKHPSLGSETVFMDEVEIAPLLLDSDYKSVSNLLTDWSVKISYQKANRLMIHLFNSNIFCTPDRTLSQHQTG